MRTSLKLSVIAIAAASVIGGSAAAATASERSYERSNDQTNVCGNSAQEARASRGGENDQSYRAAVLCQSGKVNRYVSVVWAPQWSLM
ncbi:hypothetical protein [Streptomyces meridianus]|uniref:Secreted protein n=1 Tax=Streptomyces meridianus TaxID=2938945 RepID=A0ABT0X859_9ACTN|nr:hypothetical protein [Streptomyces meridianus]MCM2578118.1 hypothetical protein [Streptomyces meridianus]